MLPGSCRAASRFLVLLLVVCDCAGGKDTVPSQSAGATVPANVTVCELVKNPEQYSGKEVTIEADYILGFEWSALYSWDCPDGRIWLERHGLDDVSKKELQRAYDNDLSFVYLKVQGTFASGGHYGHMGGYSYQLVAHKVFTVLRVESEINIVTDGEGLDWTPYWRAISTSVRKSWIANMPESVHQGQQGRNSVGFSVQRDGSVPQDSVKLVSGSDTRELDEASIKAVYAAAPFGHLPERFSEPSILLCAVFYYNARPNHTKEESPYFKALYASTLEMEKAYAKIDDSIGGSKVRMDYHHVLVERDAGITDGLPEQFGDYHFEYLDDGQLTAKYKKLRKQFPILKVHPANPANPTGSLLRVSVYWVSYEKGKLKFGLSDWSEVIFRFDCEKRTDVVAKVKLGGI